MTENGGLESSPTEQRGCGWGCPASPPSDWEEEKASSIPLSSGTPVRMGKAFKTIVTTPVDITIKGAKTTKKTVTKTVSNVSTGVTKLMSRSSSDLVEAESIEVVEEDSSETEPDASNAEKPAVEEHEPEVVSNTKPEQQNTPFVTKNASKKTGKEDFVDRVQGILLRETTATMGEMLLFASLSAAIPTLIAWEQVKRNQIPFLVALAWVVAVLIIDRAVNRMGGENTPKQNPKVKAPVHKLPNVWERSARGPNPEHSARDPVLDPPETEPKLEKEEHTVPSDEVLEIKEREPLAVQLEELRYPPPPPLPTELPARFLAAGKGDPVVGQERFKQTLEWRTENSIDYILRQKHAHFELIKKNYPHFFHLRGKNNEPVYFECPPNTNLQAMRDGGCDLEMLLRHYAMVTEFTWQYIERSDSAKSIYVVDLEGMGMRDFAGEVVDFVKQATAFTGAHYPERMGHMMVINVPSWFKIIYNVVKPMVDEDTLKKVSILRGKDEIFEALCERIPVENIPPEYGGESMPLGESPQEQLIRDLMKHNNDPSKCILAGGKNDCRFCKFQLARSY